MYARNHKISKVKDSYVRQKPYELKGLRLLYPPETVTSQRSKVAMSAFGLAGYVSLNCHGVIMITPEVI